MNVFQLKCPFMTITAYMHRKQHISSHFVTMTTFYDVAPTGPPIGWNFSLFATPLSLFFFIIYFATRLFIQYSPS